MHGRATCDRRVTDEIFRDSNGFGVSYRFVLKQNFFVHTRSMLQSVSLLPCCAEFNKRHLRIVATVNRMMKLIVAAEIQYHLVGIVGRSSQNLPEFVTEMLNDYMGRYRSSSTGLQQAIFQSPPLWPTTDQRTKSVHLEEDQYW